MANQNLVLSRAHLVEYVNKMLNEWTPFKQIARSLEIADPRQLKRMLSKALGYKIQVYHHFTTSEMSNTIKGALPNREHGANWGIWHVKAALARLQIKAPRRTIARALQILSGNRNQQSILFIYFIILFWL